MDNYSEGLATGMALQQGNPGYSNGGFGFGGEWGGLIGLLIVASLFGGNGWGFGGNRGGNMGGYELGRLATTNDVASGFSTSAMMSDLNDILLGQAGIQQTLCQGFSGVNATVNQVGNTINQGICTLGYNMQTGFNNVQRQLSDCCCDLINNQNSNTQRIIDYMTCEKISALQAENSALKGQLSQNAQTNTIINTLRPVAQPAYITCSPYETAFGFNRNSGNCCC